MSHKFDEYLKQIMNYSLFNTIIAAILMIGEFMAIFVEIPVVFVSFGDSAGIADFSGNWFDHILKMGIGILLFLIFLTSMRNLTQTQKDSVFKGYSFAFGGALLASILGILHIAIYSAQVLDMVIVGEFYGAFLWESLRLELLFPIVNLGMLKIWRTTKPLLKNSNTQKVASIA